MFVFYPPFMSVICPLVHQDASQGWHRAITLMVTAVLFLGLAACAYTDSLFVRFARLLSALVWLTLLLLLYLLVSFHRLYLPTNEVGLVLLVVAAVYTTLPLPRPHAVAAGVLTCLPHIVVLGALSQTSSRDTLFQVSDIPPNRSHSGHEGMYYVKFLCTYCVIF